VVRCCWQCLPHPPSCPARTPHPNAPPPPAGSDLTDDASEGSGPHEAGEAYQEPPEHSDDVVGFSDEEGEEGAQGGGKRRAPGKGEGEGDGQGEGVLSEEDAKRPPKKRSRR
jgi:hypothetical protein